MADHRTSELEKKRDALLAGALKNVRSATLAASLVPVALVAAEPTMAYAQDCGFSGAPPCPVPEPEMLLLLGPAAAAMLVRHRRNTNSRRGSTPIK
jgi:hypothetical protein